MGEYDKSDGFNVRPSLRAKRKCQLIVKLKAIEYKKDISHYLSSYTILLGRL